MTDEVRFRVRVSDLKRNVRQLTVTRAGMQDHDPVDLLV